MSMFRNLLMQRKDWSGKPADWADIRKDCPANSIALYVGELGSNYIIKDGRLTWANPNIYLQSTDNSDTYIDSGLKSQTFSKIECDFQRVSDGISCFFGGRQAANNNETDWRYIIDSYRYKFVNGSTTYNAYNQASNFNKHKMVYENGSVFLDGTEIISNIQQISFEGTRNIYLFANNNNGAVQTEAKKACKLYNVKFYVDGTLVRHFVPVPSGLVIGDFTCPSDGMFDIVEQQFYANASTGTFTYGKDSVTNDYDNLGFTATCTGGYNVFIDGTQYGSTYASGSQCNITWSTSGITTGDDITTPSALKAHKIWISPATEGNNITNFSCSRVAASGTEQQGVLWAHFNLSNSIKVSLSAYDYVNQKLEAITSKNNILHLSDLALFAYNCPSLTYCSVINCDNNQVTIGTSFTSCGNIKEITIKNAIAKYDFSWIFNNCGLLKKITFKNVDTLNAVNFSRCFNGCLNLKKLPEGLRFDNAQDMVDFLTYAAELENTVLDVSTATRLKKIGCYGNSTYFMGSLKGLTVSNQAPFDASTPPQINVSYTGMNRNALVTLFNDLPTVSAGQIINITACTGSEDLSAQEVAIATNKGWTVTGGPDFETYYAYTDNDNSVYSKQTPISAGTFTLQNATNSGFTELERGIYEGNASNKIVINDVPDWANINTWSIIQKVKFDISKVSVLIGSASNKSPILSRGTNGKLTFYPYSSTGNISSNTLDLNVWYYIKTYFTGIAYKVDVSTTGAFNGEEINYFDIESSSKVSSTAKIWFGNNSYNTSENLGGYIDMSASSITLDGVTTSFGVITGVSTLYNSSLQALSPQPSYDVFRVGLTPLISTVGTLTDNSGVYSGFSNSNYFLTKSITLGSSWNIIVKITTPSELTTTQYILGREKYFDLYLKNNLLSTDVGNGSSWTATSQTGTTELQPNTDYFIKYEKASENYNIYLSTTQTFSDTPEITLSSTNFNSILRLPIGRIVAASTSLKTWSGSIDMLNSCVTIDGVAYPFYNAIEYITINNSDYVRTPANDLLG